MALFWIEFGFFYKKYLSIYFENYAKKWGGYSVLPLLLSIALTSFNGKVDLHFTKLGSPAIFFSIAICGCCSLIMLSIFLSERIFTVNKILKYLGENSLIIFALHTRFRIVLLAQAYVKHWYVFQDRFFYTLSVALVTTIICCFLVEIFNNNFKFIFNYSAFREKLGEYSDALKAPVR